MSVETAEIADAIEEFHEDVSHDFQVSLSMSLSTRNALDAIQDELNEAAGERICTTNDAMRAALLAGARYHELATEHEAELDEFEREQLLPLTSVIQTVVEDQNTVE